MADEVNYVDQERIYKRKSSTFLINEGKFEANREIYIQELKEKGIDISDISLKPDKEGNIDYSLDTVHACMHKSTDYIIPLDNKFMESLLSCKKLVIASEVFDKDDTVSATDKTKMTRENDLSVTHLVGMLDGKPYEFTISVYKDPGNLLDFGMSISVLVSKEHNLWLDLARLDSKGKPHPNYILGDGKFVKDFNDIKFIPSPHVHKNSQEAMLITEGSQNAYEISDRTIKQRMEKNDRTAFKDALKYMLTEICNVDLREISDYMSDFNFHKGCEIFDEEKCAKTFEQKSTIKGLKDLDNNTNNAVPKQLGRKEKL